MNNTQKPQHIVEKANEQWNKALNNGELDKLVDLYDQAATVSPGNGALLEGQDAIKTLFSGFIENGVHDHKIETIDIIASEGLITQVGYWEAKGFDADQQIIKFGGVLITVLKKNASDEWLLQSHVWNVAS